MLPTHKQEYKTLRFLFALIAIYEKVERIKIKRGASICTVTNLSVCACSVVKRFRHQRGLNKVHF